MKSRKKRKEQQKVFEFSKFIYLFNVCFVAIVVTISFICIIKSGAWGIVDLSPISIICTSAFAELGVSSSLYSWKARSENVLKIANSIEKEKMSKQSISMANSIANQTEIIDTEVQG